MLNWCFKQSIIIDSISINSISISISGSGQRSVTKTNSKFNKYSIFYNNITPMNIKYRKKDFKAY